MNETLFTKIIKGEIPSHKIYEDELTYAFLDIYPVAPGHVLVIPKKPVEFIWDLEDEDYQALMATVKKVGEHVRAVLPQKHVGVKVVGVDVPHAHVHIIPFDEVHEYANNPDQSGEPDHELLAEIATKLRMS